MAFQSKSTFCFSRSLIAGGTIVSLLLGNNLSLATAQDETWAFLAQEARVVSATKYARRTSDAPANAYVITSDEMEAFGHRTLAEALQSVPGLYVTDDRNYSYIWVRGFGRPGDYNSRVLLLIDGHRVNENIYGSSYLKREFSLPVQAIHQIEVIKGPGSALHGDNAFFAVINVVTKKPVLEEGARLSVEGAGYGTHEEYAGMSRRFDGGLEISAHAAYRSTDGQDLYYPEYSSVNNGIAENSDREENYAGYAEISKNGITVRGNSANRRKTIPTGAFAARFNDSGTGTQDKRDFVELQIDRPLNGWLRAMVRTYYDRYSYRGDYALDGSVPPDRLINRDVAKSRWYGEEINLQATPFGPENSLLLGQEYERNIQGLQQNFDLDPAQEYMNDNREPYRWAAFAQQEWWPIPQMGMTLGVRYDHYESFGKTVNPRTALLYRPWRGGTAKFMYGNAFRAPSPYEMFYVTPLSYKSNPDLKPEKVQSYEARLEQEFPENGGSVGVGLFQNRVRNLINQVMDPSDGLLIYVNSDRVVSRGCEFNSRWNLTRALTFRTGYTFQRTEDGRGEVISNSPEHSGSAGFTQRLSRWKALLALEAFFVSSRKTVKGTVLPSTAVLNVNVTAHPFSPNFGVRAGVYNLTNASYAVSASGEHLQDSILQDKRGFQAGVDYRFGPRGRE